MPLRRLQNQSQMQHEERESDGALADVYHASPQLNLNLFTGQ